MQKIITHNIPGYMPLPWQQKNIGAISFVLIKLLPFKLTSEDDQDYQFNLIGF